MLALLVGKKNINLVSHLEVFSSLFNKINQENSEFFYKSLAESVYDLMLIAEHLNKEQQRRFMVAFDFLMQDQDYLSLQRILLSRYSSGNKRVLAKTSQVFAEKLNEILASQLIPKKSYLILILLLRKCFPFSVKNSHKITKWHRQAIVDLNAEESLLLYNTMFNQTAFLDNVAELIAALPSLDWVQQYVDHGIKKIMTYLYFWREGHPTDKLVALRDHLIQNTLLLSKSIEHQELMHLLNRAIDDAINVVADDPSRSINRRWSQLLALPSHYGFGYALSKPKLRVAVLVSGQLRGYQQTLAHWQQHLFRGVEVDYYVHTWKQVGRSGAEPFRRFLPFQGKNFISAYRDECAKMGYQSFVQAYPSLFHSVHNASDVTQDSLCDFYKTNYIVIEDENEPQFSGWSNSQKMHYKLSASQQLLNQSGQGYDLVLRIRPDKDVKLMLANWHTLYRLTQTQQTILADFPMGIHYGGLMMGDQIALGSQSSMLVLNGVYDSAQRLADKELIKMNQFFSGHTTLAKHCLIYNLAIGKFPAIFGGLVAAEPLSSQSIHDQLILDAEGRKSRVDERLLKAIDKDLKW